MHKIEYPDFSEIIYQETLSNGLMVNLLPKAKFNKTYATLTANFGSINTEFVLDATKYKIPAGTAHFLEHKLFEKETYDAFEEFSKNGASANAFTSYSKTSYLFSTTTNLVENLNNLLTFVYEPYFTEDTVQKEQGIIGQEIQMYNDDPEWQLYIGIMHNLFPDHALGEDIAGTIDSIKQIDADLLYKIHQKFYHPSNMNLFIAGGFESEKVLEVIKKYFEKNSISSLQSTDESYQDTINNFASPVIMRDEIKLEVSRPKIILGLRNYLKDINEGQERLKILIGLEVAFHMLLSSNSKAYLNLYNKNIIDDSFNYEINLEHNFLFITIGGDTTKSEIFKSEIQKIILNGLSSLNNNDNFSLTMKELLGKSIAGMDSMEIIANSFEGQEMGNINIFDEARMFKSITLNEVLDVYKNYIGDNTVSSFVLKSLD